MIKYHPKHELLGAFVAGQLPASMSIAISAHADICDICQQKIRKMTESAAQAFSNSEAYDDDNSFEDSFSLSDIESILANDEELVFENMINEITSNDDISHVKAKAPVEIEFNGRTVKLPNALSSVALSSWQKIGKLKRAKIDLNEGAVHTNLIEIEAGGAVPCHTHKGYELTLLLEGSFEDEHGTYHKGDFILLSQEHTHKPFTAQGCVCLTIADDAQEFTEGFSKLLNPIGRYLY